MATLYDTQLVNAYNKHLMGVMMVGGKQPTPAQSVIDDTRNYFTRYFGVRILDFNDLANLEIGAAAYMKSPNNAGQDAKAVDRAVALKQTYFPESLYRWDATNFSKFPYVADIPDPKIGMPPLLTLPAVQHSDTLNDVVVQDTIQQGTGAQALTPPPVVDPVTPEAIGTEKSLLERFWYVPLVGLVLVGTIVYMATKKS